MKKKSVKDIGFGVVFAYSNKEDLVGENEKTNYAQSEKPKVKILVFKKLGDVSEHQIF